MEHFYSSAPALASEQPETEAPGAEKTFSLYIEAMGGNEAIDRLKQLSFSGSVFTDQDQFTFEGSNSRTEGYAVRLYDTDTVVALDLQGRSGNTLSLPSDSSSEPMILVLKSIFSDFDNPAVRHLLSGNGEVLEVERAKVGKMELLCFSIKINPTTTVKLYLDKRTMQLIAREDKKNGAVFATYRYSQHKPVRGVMLPQTVVAQIKGLPTLRMHYATMKAPETEAGNLDNMAMLSSGAEYNH